MNYPFDSSRETLGLMVCHAVCGAVGALPPTGVFVRTSLNVPWALEVDSRNYFKANIVAEYQKRHDKIKVLQENMFPCFFFGGGVGYYNYL